MKKETTMFTKVRKRDGSILDFEQSRITSAIFKALNATGEGGEEEAARVSDKVLKALKKEHSAKEILDIETIQNYVERTLMLLDYTKTAKAYILYREKRAEVREKKKEVPEKVKQLVADSKKFFSDDFSEYIFFSRYSRWIESEGRRETWIESVQRYFDFMFKNLGNKMIDQEYGDLKEAVLNMRVMPSMRLFWSAGGAAESTNVSGYNCSFIAISELQDFGEIMYLSMCGTGVGFSVEYQSIEKLPQIKRQTGKPKVKIVVEDSKEGWADAFVKCMRHWYDGKDVEVDYSELRPMGARLHTMGGRSSGPGPLKALMEFARDKVLERQDRRLKPIDVHDIACKVGEIVEMGGVRRSAMLSLSNLDDLEMRVAKDKRFWERDEKQRHMANNSVAYASKPTDVVLMKEWQQLAEGGTGERGIFNRAGLKDQLPPRRWKIFEKDAATSGTNPCGEIVLKSKQFCNLTEVICRAEDTEETLLEKVRLATIMGTYQATLTNFPYLSKEWKENCDEERLLGVSLTGQWDCPAVRNPETLRKLKERAVEVNKEYAKRFGINQSTAITCVKPSGTVSQLVNSASGLHTRYAKYYLRRTRLSATDPIFEMLKEQKYPYEADAYQSTGALANYVITFVVKAPEGAITRRDKNVVQQLDYWKILKENYTEHNPSASIYIKPEEWIEAVHWVRKNWDMVGGLAFFSEQNVYVQSPYEEIMDDVAVNEKTGEMVVVKTAEEKYRELKAKLPEINFADIVLYEQDDETKGAKEAACAGGVCEI
ncbi:MAG: ATP cone domain-containing protein [bacterium]|nr:ATP cone domain-containing protein [bacterium]